MASVEPYSQGQLTFVDIGGGEYGADTQGLDYEYAFTPLSQTQTQTQPSQLTQPDAQPIKCKYSSLLCYNNYYSLHCPYEPFFIA